MHNVHPQAVHSIETSAAQFQRGIRRFFHRIHTRYYDD